MEDLSIRPGFNLHAAFRGHLSSVRRITYNTHTKQFLSMDEHCLKAWTVDRDGNTRVQYDVQFPGYQQNFITAMVLSQELNLLFTACLDDNVRLYNERLRLKSCMPWSNGVVREMLFYEPRSLLVTAGSYGVKVWECLLDYEAFRTDKTSDLYDVPKIKDGSVLPWCFGKYQHVRLRCTLHVPGARLMGGVNGPGATGGSGGVSTSAGPRDAANITTSGSVPDSETAATAGTDGELINAPWCDRIALHEPTAMVLAMFQGHVYGFDIMNGTCLSSYTGLYTQPVTSCVFVPESDLLYTTAMDTSAVLWRIPRGCEAQRFKQFGRTYAPMTVVVQDPDMKHVLTTSLDGSVTLWDMETLVPVFKMKLSKAPVSTAFYKPNAFFLATDTEVKIFTITHLFEAWMDCNSPVVRLRPVSYGLIQAEFADSSVRLLDAHDSTRPDKSVLVTMPQLSAQQLLASVVALTSARLFVLLADGAVHVWQLHLRRPPSFLAAWTHLARESGVSLAYIDGGVLSPQASSRMSLPYDHVTGFTHDHLVMGTVSGDCVLVDVTSGHISFRFPAYKHQPLQILSPDLDRGVLVTVSRTIIKIWTLHDMRCMHELCTSKPVTRVELLEGRAVIGTVSGSVHVMELSTGAANAASVTVDHMDAVTGIGPSVFLQHVVTGSKDSHIKIFDRDKRFKRSIYVGAPVAAVTYLNDKGDILAAMGTRLVIIRVDKYDRLPSAPKESIYDELRGQGRAPRTLLRAMQSRLQRLSRCKVPLQAYAAWVAEEGGAGPDGAASSSASSVMNRRRTPPLRRLRSVILSDSLERIMQQGSGSTGGSGKSLTGRPSSQRGAVTAATATAAVGVGSAVGTPQMQRSPSSGALASAAAVAAAAVTGASRPSSVLKGVLKSSSALIGESETQDLRPASRDTASRGGSRSVQWQGAKGGPTHGTEAAITAAGGPGSGPGTKITTPRTQGDGEDATGGGGGGASDRGDSGADVAKSEDEDEGKMIAREMYPLKFTYNLHKEKMRIDRLIHGLPSIPTQQRVNRAAIEPERPRTASRTPSRESEATAGRTHAAAASGASTGAAFGSGGDSNGAPSHSQQQQLSGNQQQQQQPASQTGAGPLLLRLATLQIGGSDGVDRSLDTTTADDSQDASSRDDDEGYSSETASVSGSENNEPTVTAAGLSARFRRTLPVIASPSAFFDGHIPPEALLRTKKAGGSVQKAQPQQKAKRPSVDSAAATAGVSERVSGDGTAAQAGGLCSTADGDAAVAEAGWGIKEERGKSGSRDKEGGAEAAGDGAKKKKKKKKKKKRRRGAPGDKDLVEELKARLDYEIRAEVKAYEKHQTVQRLARSTFLPRLGGPAVTAAAAASRASLVAPVMPGSRTGTEPGFIATNAAASAAANTAATTAAGGRRHSDVEGVPPPPHLPPAAPAALSMPLSAAPSFKAMLKGLGVRGAVADLARILQDPSRFVVAQDQGAVAGGAGDRTSKTSPRKDDRRVTMALQQQQQQQQQEQQQQQPEFAGGQMSGSGSGADTRVRSASGAVVGRGSYGFKAFMEAYSK